jgi:hypothetical protein
MNLTVLKVFRRVNFRAKPKIAFIVHPNPQRLEIGPEHPLPYIELFLFNNERFFYVLLCNPRNLTSHHIL